MAHSSESLMRVEDINALTDHNVSKHLEEPEHGRENGRIVETQARGVVDFEATGEVANAGPIPVLVR